MPSEPSAHIRPAREHEAARIRSLVRSEHLNPFGLDWRRFLVAEDNDSRVIGCVQHKLHRSQHKEPVRELASLVVRPERRGQGLGAALVRHLQAQTGPPLWLMCRSRLVPFYEQFGFREVKRKREMPLYFGLLRTGFDLGTLGRRTSDYLAIMVWQG